MDATAQCQAERRDCPCNCRRTVNRARWTIEDADKAIARVSNFPASESRDLSPYRVVVPIEQRAPVPVTQFGYPPGRIDDIGYQQSGKYPVMLDGSRNVWVA